MLRTRILSAAVFAPALFGIIWTGGIALQMACLILSLAMVWEFFRMLPLELSGLAQAGTYGATALTVAGVYGWLPPELSTVLAPLVTLLLILVSLVRVESMADGLPKMAALFLAVAYCGGMIPHLAALREVDLGYALGALFCTWAGDTGAYFAGRALGKNKLAPTISPKKTIEGAVGGLIAAVLVGFLVRGWLMPTASATVAVAMGLLAGGLGVVGDLAESLLKRSCDVKDSSNLIPGHGGVLDRFDGVMFAAPAIYIYVVLVQGG